MNKLIYPPRSSQRLNGRLLTPLGGLCLALIFSLAFWVTIVWVVIL